MCKRISRIEKKGKKLSFMRWREILWMWKIVHYPAVDFYLNNKESTANVSDIKL